MVLLDRTTWATVISAWGIKFMNWLKLVNANDILQLLLIIASIVLVGFNIAYKIMLMKDLKKNKDEKG